MLSSALPRILPTTFRSRFVTYSTDAAIFKTFTLRERFKVRVQADFFNLTNTPGNEFGAGSDGIASTFYNMNTPRQLQLSMRATW